MKLKRFIKLKGFTMSQVCKKIKLNLAVLSLHCNGHKVLSLKHAASLAKFLNITADEVIDNNVITKLPWVDYNKEENK